MSKELLQVGDIIYFDAHKMFPEELVGDDPHASGYIEKIEDTRRKDILKYHIRLFEPICFETYVLLFEDEVYKHKQDT
jgi:hypothetical protein